MPSGSTVGVPPHIPRVLTVMIAALALTLLAPATTLQDSWSTEALSWPRSGAMVAAAGGRVFAAGGNDMSFTGLNQTVDILDEASGTFTVSQLSEGRSAGVGVGISTQVLFAGGRGLGFQGSDTVDLYDLATSAWSVANLSEGRYDLVALDVAQLAIFAGGTISQGPGGPVASDAIDIYSATAAPQFAWTTATLTRARTELAAGLHGTWLVFAGGRDGATVLADVELTNAFGIPQQTSSLSVPRYGLAGASVFGFALFAGGTDASGNPSDVVDIMLPGGATPSWTTGALSQARTHLSAFTIGSRAYFVGGEDAAGNPSDVVDIFDATTMTWSLGPPLPASNTRMHAVASGPRAYAASGVGLTTDLYAYESAPSIGTVYCTPSVPNSSGLSARIEAVGNNLSGIPLPYRVELHTAAMPRTQFTYLIASQNPGLILNPGGSAGTLCLGGSILRIWPSLTNTGFEGRTRFELDTSHVAGVGQPHSIQAGQTWHFQAWVRDFLPNGATSNFTDGLAVMFF